METRSIQYQYDVFISYASEDREPFVRKLANGLRKIGIKVWYDQFEIRVGDSLSGKITEGLLQAKFGLIIVSEHFFKKKWPMTELNTLLTRKVVGLGKVIPIIHNLTRESLHEIHPMLADIVSMDSEKGKGIGKILTAIATRILKGRDITESLIEMYQAVFSVIRSPHDEHYIQTLYASGIFRVPQGEKPVYHDIITTSSPLGSLDYFNAIPRPSDGLAEQLERSNGKYVHFELIGENGVTEMPMSAVLKLTKKMTADDGYVAFRLPYDSRFVSITFDYSGLEFDPGEFASHIDAQSTKSLEGSSNPQIYHWPERRIVIAHCQNLPAGSNPMIGWGKWVKKWNN